MTKDQIDAIIALHTNAVNTAKEAYKEAEHDCRENTFMDSGEADSYVKYVEGIEDVMSILDIPFPNWDLDDEDDEEEELTDEDYKEQFGSEMAIRICRANNIPLSDVEVYGSNAYWINDAINNLQDLYDINENFVIPTGDEDLIRDYREEILEEEEKPNLPTETTLKNFTIVKGENMEEAIHELLFEEYAFETESFDYEITRVETLDEDRQICDAKVTNITWEEE